MRAVKTTTVSILALGLLAGSAVGITAQDEAATDAVVPTPFSWTLDKAQCGLATEGTFEMNDGFGVSRGFVEAGPDCLLEADDERASGLATTVENIDFYEGEAGDATFVEVNSFWQQVVNDEGSWSGPGTRASKVTEEPFVFTTTSFATLEGDGAYEGLALILIDTGTPDGGNVGQGYIVSADFVRPIPEPPAE